MLSCYTLFENQQVISLDVKNPQELLKWMDRIEYGWMDKNYKKYYTFDKWFDNVIIMSPYKVFKHHIGTCYEQTLFEYYVFKNILKYTDLKLIHIQQYLISNHLFLAYKYNDSWFHFEHAFNRFKGIHGPYNNLNTLISKVKQMMLIQSKLEGFNKNYGFRVNYLEYDKLNDFKQPIDAFTFYKLVKYDWSKQEKSL